MDVSKAIAKRISVRAYEDRPVHIPANLVKLDPHHGTAKAAREMVWAG
jgi:hypothetical protein